MYPQAPIQAVTITIRIKMNNPKCALLAELGWEPINAFLDRLLLVNS
jgi:hypothetical protein